MASLRKKQADVASADAPLNVDTSSAPEPIPATPDALRAHLKAKEEAPLAKAREEACQALKREAEALARAEDYQRQQQSAFMTAQTRRQEWIGRSPLAQKYYQHLAAIHDEALQSGLIDTSPSYFEHMESRHEDLHRQEPATAGTHLIAEMHERAAQNGSPQSAPPPPKARPMRSNIVSAPVSREVPTASRRRYDSKTTLTPEEREMARYSGISDTEYARQKLKLQAMKEAGEYPDRR